MNSDFCEKPLGAGVRKVLGAGPGFGVGFLGSGDRLVRGARYS